MKLFKSATLKLAGWYLLILMVVSLLFSVIIFQVARQEIETRIIHFSEGQASLIAIPEKLATKQVNSATASLLISLGYINLIVLLAGGVGAYMLARLTLQPIEAAHEAQSRFIANASHQLRTPLAIIKAETELALSDPKTKRKNLTDTLRSNLEEVNHLTKLSSMLLDLSRSEQSLKNKSGTSNLAAIVREAIINRKISSRTDLEAPDDLIINADAVAVKEICGILIDNAIKHSPKGSKINIKLVENKQSACLEVKNLGQGINKRIMGHIFERFYQSGQSGGYGLGLSLAKQLTEALGGQISVSSQAGKSTTFSVILPK